MRINCYKKVDFFALLEYSIENKEKPMRKRSTQTANISESRGRCERGMGAFEEWTFEAGSELTVGAGGNRARYQSGVYDST